MNGILLNLNINHKIILIDKRNSNAVTIVEECKRLLQDYCQS